MYYSGVGILALIVLFIINREALKRQTVKGEKPTPAQRVAVRYRAFLIASICYFLSDLTWGLLYDHHEMPALFPFLYSDTVLYFIFMLLTMLTWIRYIVAYLDKRGRRSKVLLYAVWVLFLIGLIYLMINRFHPFIFSFNEQYEYITAPGRYIAFFLQIILYAVTSIYMLVIAARTNGQEKTRYTAVGLTCLVLGIFQILQILVPLFPFYAMGLLLGSCVVHSFVDEGERKEKEIYDHIASSLAEDYEAMYYIDIETGEYREFATSQEYAAMNVPANGRDFFGETKENVKRYVHPYDKEFAMSMYDKETMLENLEGRNSYTYKYRVMVGEEPRYFRFKVLRADDNRHMILCEKDIDDEITEESLRSRSQKKNITFSRIAESLASNYDVLYYVNAEDASYISYETNDRRGQLVVRKTGEDFFGETLEIIPQVVHKNDRKLVMEFADRDHLRSVMGRRKRSSIEYRLVQNGRSKYFRMTVRKTSDESHYIIGVENIDAEVKREKQQLKALNTERELARTDEMTGTRNKTAYAEVEQLMQAEMENAPDQLRFAIVVCDANNLKSINDNEGHVAGDEYIRSSANLLCELYKRDAVYRVGGDEFAVVLQGNAYQSREDLMETLRSRIRDNQKAGGGPVLAAGMATYNPREDRFVADVFNRADKEMYADKQSLKGKIQEDHHES